jgi:hypothetical protein
VVQECGESFFKRRYKMNNGNWSYEGYEQSVKQVRNTLEKVRNGEYPETGEYNRFVIWGNPKDGFAIEIPAQCLEQAIEGFQDVIEKVIPLEVGYHFYESAFIYLK